MPSTYVDLFTSSEVSSLYTSSSELKFRRSFGKEVELSQCKRGGDGTEVLAECYACSCYDSAMFGIYR